MKYILSSTAQYSMMDYQFEINLIAECEEVLEVCVTLSGRIVPLEIFNGITKSVTNQLPYYYHEGKCIREEGPMREIVPRTETIQKRILLIFLYTAALEKAMAVGLCPFDIVGAVECMHNVCAEIICERPYSMEYLNEFRAAKENLKFCDKIVLSSYDILFSFVGLDLSQVPRMMNLMLSCDHQGVDYFVRKFFVENGGFSERRTKAFERLKLETDPFHTTQQYLELLAEFILQAPMFSQVVSDEMTHSYAELDNSLEYYDGLKLEPTIPQDVVDNQDRYIFTLTTLEGIKGYSGVEEFGFTNNLGIAVRAGASYQHPIIFAYDLAMILEGLQCGTDYVSVDGHYRLLSKRACERVAQTSNIDQLYPTLAYAIYMREI